MPTLGSIPSEPNNEVAEAYENLYRGPSAQDPGTLQQQALSQTLNNSPDSPTFVNTPGGQTIASPDGPVFPNTYNPNGPVPENPLSSATSGNFSKPYQPPTYGPNAYKTPNSGGGSPGGSASPGGGGVGASAGGSPGGGASPGGAPEVSSGGGGIGTLEAPGVIVGAGETGGGGLIGGLGALAVPVAILTGGLLAIGAIFAPPTANDSPPPQPAIPAQKPYKGQIKVVWDYQRVSDGTILGNSDDQTYGNAPFQGFINTATNGGSNFRLVFTDPTTGNPQLVESLGSADLYKPINIRIYDSDGNLLSTGDPSSGSSTSPDIQSPNLAPGDPPLPNYNPATQPPPSATNEQNKKQPSIVQVPDNTPFTISQPDSPEIYFPGNQPGWQFDLPPGDNPYPNGQPINIGQPGKDPTTINFPGANPTQPYTINIPGYEPIKIDPTGQTAPQGLGAPDPLNGNKQGLVPAPLTATPTTPTTPIDPSKQATPAPFLYDPTLQSIATGLTGLGIVVKGILDQTSAANQAKNAATGVCQTTAPGGCTSNLVNNAGNNTANNINTTLNAADLGLLKVIDNKLGAQIPNGIGPTLSAFKDGFKAFVDWSQIGRVLDLLTLLGVLHNAFMLSQGVEQTLVQVAQDVLNALLPAFGVDTQKDPINLQEILGKTADNFLKDLFGAKTVKKWEALFKTYNRIYQAATNMLFNVQMMVFSTTMALQMLGENISSIGNALKKYGVVGHHAYPEMNKKPDFKTRFVGAIEKVTGAFTGLLGAAAVIDAVAQAALADEQGIKQLGDEQEKVRKEMYEGYALTKETVGLPVSKSEALAAATAIKVSGGANPKPEGLQ